MIYDPPAMVKVWTDLNKLDRIRVQLKKNGSRAIVWIEGGKVTIYDRHHTTLTMSLERDWTILCKIYPDKTLLDGELIGRKQGEVSNRLYLWDMPICGGEDLHHLSYAERYSELIEVFSDYCDGEQKCGRLSGVTEDPEWDHAQFGKVEIGIARSYPAAEWLNLLRDVNYAGSTGENEGLVFKEMTHDLSWSYVKTKDIKEQKKFLLKYHSIATGK